MKKLVLLTSTILFTFLCVTTVLSFWVSQSWQQPQVEDVNITINPTVDEFLEDKVKQYKFKAVEIMDNGYKRYLNDDELTPPEDGMITFAGAADCAGDALSKLYPDITWEDIEFEIRLSRINGEYTDYYGRTILSAEKPFFGYNNYCFYYVDPYNGKVIQAGYYNDDFLQECPVVDYYDSAKVAEGLRETILQRGFEVASAFGYNDVTLVDMYATGNHHSGHAQYAQGYSIILLTDSGKVLDIRLYDIAEKNYPFKEFQWYLPTE